MTNRRGLQLMWWSLLGVVVLVALYLVMVRLGAGQLLDDTASEGRKATRLAVRRGAAAAVRVATPAMVVVVGATVVASAFKLRGLISAAASTAALLGTVVAARVLKTELPRTDLVPNSWVSSINTFPSGHTAAVTALALVAVAVSPPQWRPRLSAAAAAVLVAHTVAVAGAGWHRSSDLFGAMALAVAFSGVASVLITGRWRGDVAEARPAWFDQPRRVLRGLMVTVIAVLCWYVPARLLVKGFAGSAGTTGFVLHVALALGACAAAVAAIATHAHLTNAADVARIGVVDARPSAASGSITCSGTTHRPRPR